MKALSIQQPWAWAILHAGKDIENRTWPTDYRGPLLIHASKRYDHNAANFIIPRLDWGMRAHLPDGGIPGPKLLPCGGIMGMVQIVGCAGVSRKSYTPHSSPWFEGPYGFVLRYPQELPFLPWPGKLGLFDFPDELLPRLGLTKVTAPKNDNEKRYSGGQH